MVVVTEGTVIYNGASYIAGEAITGMTEADEMRLVGLNVCRKIEQEQTDSREEPPGLQEKAGAPDSAEAAGLNLNIDPDEIIKAPPKGKK